MAGPGNAGDIPLDTPLARHRDVVSAVEDRSYVVFIAGALAFALGAGFPLAILLALAASGLFWVERVPWLTQAHGWAQLQGWGGLFVAGMGLRLLPRFAGRRPLPRSLNAGIFALLAGGSVLRTVAQPFAGAGATPAVFLAGQLLWATGSVGFAATVGWTLARGRQGADPWRLFAMAGTGWWLAWAAASVAAGIRGARNDAFVLNPLDDMTAWVAMLGAVGNFIWGVQSRSVPIFFGRRLPRLRTVAAPALALNAGVAAVFLAGWLDLDETRARIEGAGLVAAGCGIAWLAPVAGSCWGRAHRLRPRAQAAARFVVAANLAAVASGVLLAWAGLQSAWEGGLAEPGLRDGARHIFGLGTMTMLIVGMAQLVAPFFAMQRVESQGSWIVDRGVFWLLTSAVVLRGLAAVLSGHASVDGRMHLSATAGALAWFALALFASTVWRAIRREGGVRSAIAAQAGAGTVAQPGRRGPTA